MHDTRKEGNKASYKLSKIYWFKKEMQHFWTAKKVGLTHHENMPI